MKVHTWKNCPNKCQTANIKKMEKSTLWKMTGKEIFKTTGRKYVISKGKTD